ncbi:DUF1758 domain-containing protein [Trichonephila clavipes]|nr:DUF1758 domain-containing protein [Trichonephila clavipes]
MINLAHDSLGKNNGVVKRSNKKIVVANVSNVAKTAMLVSTNASHDGIPKANGSSEVANNLSNNNYNDKVYLQTICVEIVGQGNKIRVRGLLDSTSSRSYVRDKVIKYLKLKPLTDVKRKPAHILENLRINKVELSDAFCNDEVGLLLGADLGKCVQLNFGLAAVHTKLVWTVIGKETGLSSSCDGSLRDLLINPLGESLG